MHKPDRFGSTPMFFMVVPLRLLHCLVHYTMYSSLSQAHPQYRAPTVQQDQLLMLVREPVKGPCGLMDKALVFGTKDCRFESCQGHLCIHRLVATAVGSIAKATHALVQLCTLKPRG